MLPKQGISFTIGTFTHFISFPFLNQNNKNILKNFQDQILDCFDAHEWSSLIKNNFDLFHITVSMLRLTSFNKNKVAQILQNSKNILIEHLKGRKLTISGLNYFRKSHLQNPYQGITLLYLDFIQDQSYMQLIKVVDLLIRQLLNHQIIFPNDLKSMKIQYDHNQNLFKSQKLHITMFTIKPFSDKINFENALKKIQKISFNKQIELESIDIYRRFDHEQMTRDPFVRINLQ